MSRAFVREDVDPPERRSRSRATSGLPPGAINYLTARGARRLRAKLDFLRADSAANAERIREVEKILVTATVVEAPEKCDEIIFGAVVAVEDDSGARRAYSIVGVDELHLHEGAVSWLSPMGRALLAAELGQRLTLPDGDRARIVSVDYPPD